jgi:MFS family permease
MTVSGPNVIEIKLERLIDDMRYRGWTDFVINGSFWIGAAVGAVASIILLDPALLPPDWGWRVAFLIGAALGLVIFLMRTWLPESPRWLMTHGRVEEANGALEGIEAEFRARGHRLDDRPLPVTGLRPRRFTPLADVAKTLFRVERRRTLVGLTLVAQAFFYNAIFFTYALVLTDFYGIQRAVFALCPKNVCCLYRLNQGPIHPGWALHHEQGNRG